MVKAVDRSERRYPGGARSNGTCRQVPKPATGPKEHTDGQQEPAMTEREQQLAAIEAIKHQTTAEFWRREGVTPIVTPYGLVDPRQERNRSLIERYGTLTDLAALDAVPATGPIPER
jgi:hypothetical protein